MSDSEDGSRGEAGSSKPVEPQNAMGSDLLAGSGIPFIRHAKHGQVDMRLLHELEALDRTDWIVSIIAVLALIAAIILGSLGAWFVS
jgi:hypothetical protein